MYTLIGLNKVLCIFVISLMRRHHRASPVVDNVV